MCDDDIFLIRYFLFKKFLDGWTHTKNENLRQDILVF